VLQNYEVGLVKLAILQALLSETGAQIFHGSDHT